jgi:hypothetical protein
MQALKRTMDAVMLIAALTVAVLTTSAGETERATFWVENDSIDLGRVVAGRDATATFVFHNDGETEVRIIKAAPS